MANGNNDILLNIGGNTKPLEQEIFSLSKRLPAINLKFNSQPLGTISKDVNAFRDSLRAAELRTIAFASAASQLFLVQRAFASVTKSVIDTEKSLTDINVVLGLSQRQLTQFSAGLFKIANETGNSFKVAADGAVELSRQGLGAAETLKRLKDALTLTRLSGLDVEKSISAITAAINSFNDVALDSTVIINKLANVDAQFAVSTGDLAEALSRVGSTAKDAGVGFDELIGFVTAAKQITQRDGSVIGNALKTIFQRIQRPEVLDNLRELGILTQDVNGKTRNAQEILIDLAKSYETLSDAQQQQVVQLSAGVYQSNQFRAILGDLAKQNSIYTRAVEASSTASDQAARRQAELNKTLSASINETINNLTKVSAKIGEATLKPVFDRVLGIVNSLTGKIDEQTGKAGESAGSTIGEGLLRGIGNYLSGPGLVLGLGLIGKLVSSFAITAVKSLANIIEGNNSRIAQEKAINALLQSQPNLLREIGALGNNQASIQEKIGQIILQNNAGLNQQLSIVAAIRAETAATGTIGNLANKVGALGSKSFRVEGETLKRAAVGVIPAVKESIGAIQAGYQPGNVKELHIPQLGRVIYNDAEKVKYFPGLSQPAIIPPQNSRAGLNYRKEFENSHGFNPYKAEGLVPNYANPSLLRTWRGVPVGAVAYDNINGKIIDVASVNKLQDLGSHHSLLFPKIRKDIEAGHVGWATVGGDGKVYHASWWDNGKGEKWEKTVASQFTNPNPDAKATQLNLFSSGFNPYKAEGYVPNFLPQISRQAAAELIKNNRQKISSLTYNSSSLGREVEVNNLQWSSAVRNDLKTGARPGNIRRQAEGNFITLRGLFDGSKEHEIKNISLDKIKQLRSGGETYDILNRGLVPSFANVDIFRGLAVNKYGGKYVLPTLPTGVSQSEAFKIFSQPKFPSKYGALDTAYNPNHLLDKLVYSRLYDTIPGVSPFSLDKNISETFATERLQRKNRGVLLNSTIDSSNIFKTLSQLKDAFKQSQDLSNGIFGLGEKIGGNIAISPGLLLNHAVKSGKFDKNNISNLRNYIRNEKELSLIGDKILNINNIEEIRTSKGYIPNYNLVTPELVKKISPEILSTFTRGGDLLKYVKSLGLKGQSGSSRLFVPLNNKIGLKVALNKAGVAQNETEFPILGGDYYARQQYDDILPKGYRYDDNNFLYGFVERLQAATSEDFKTATGKPKRDFLKDYATTGRLSEVEEQIVDFGRNYDLQLGDFVGGRNVGLGATSSGRFGLKLLDVGANERVMREFYQKRDLGAFGQTKIKIPINFKNTGSIPNFADSGLVAAVKRENAAGIPLSQIRVGQSPIIKSAFNPLGLGVYNTKDEPQGLNQGIQRVAAAGYDPKKSGIPNFAKPLNFNDFTSPEDRSQVTSKFTELQESVKKGSLSASDALKSLSEVGGASKLLKESIVRVEKSFKLLETGAKERAKIFIGPPNFSNEDFDPGRFYNIKKKKYGYLFGSAPSKTDIEESQLFASGAGGYARQFGIESDALFDSKQKQITAQQKDILDKQQRAVRRASLIKREGVIERAGGKLSSLESILSEADKAGGLSNASYATLKADIEKSKIGKLRVEALAKRAEESNIGYRRGEIGNKVKEFNETVVGSRYSKFDPDSARNLIKEVKNSDILTDAEKKEIKKNIISAGQENRNVRFTKASEDAYNKLNFFDALNPFSDYSKNQKKFGNTQAAQAFNQKFQNTALLTQFAVPTIAGVGEQTLLNQYGNSTGGRGAARAVGSLGNIASSALLGASVAGPGGLVVGAAIGGGLALATEIPSIINAFTDTLPDLKRNLEDTVEANNRASTSFGRYIESAEQLSNFKGTVFDYKKLQNINSNALTSLPQNVPGREEIIKLIGQNKFSEARNIINNNEFNQSLLTNALKDTAYLTGGKLTSDDEKLASKAYDIITETIPGVEGYGSGTVQTKVLNLQGAKDFVGKSDYFNTINSQYSNLIGGQFVNREGKLQDIAPIIQNATKGQTTGDGFIKALKDVIPKIESDRGEVKYLEDLATKLEITRKKYGDDILNQVVLPNFKAENQNRIDRQKNISLGSRDGAEQAAKLNKALLELSKTLSGISTDLETKIIINFGKFAQSLDAEQINFTKNQSIAALKNPGNEYFSAQQERDSAIFNSGQKAAIETRTLQDNINKTAVSSLVESYREIGKKDEAIANSGSSEQNVAAAKRATVIKELAKNDPLIKEIQDKVNSGQDISREYVESLIKITEKRAENYELFNDASPKLEGLAKDYDIFLREQSRISKIKNPAEILSSEKSFKDTYGISSLSNTGIIDFYNKSKTDVGSISEKYNISKEVLDSLVSELGDNLTPETLKVLLAKKTASADAARVTAEKLQQVSGVFQTNSAQIQSNRERENAAASLSYGAKGEFLTEKFKESQRVDQFKFLIDQRQLREDYGFDKKIRVAGFGTEKNELNRQKDLARVISDKVRELNRGGLDIGADGGEEDISRLVNRLRKSRDIAKANFDKTNSNDPLLKDYYQNQLNDSQSKYEPAIKAQDEINRAKEEGIAKSEIQNEEDLKNLKILEKRLQATRAANQARARDFGYGALTKDDALSAIRAPLQTTEEDLAGKTLDNLQTAAESFRSSIGDAFAEAATGSKNLGDAMRDAGLQFAKGIAARGANQLTDTLFGAAFGTGQTGQSILGGGNNGYIGDLLKSIGSYFTGKASGGLIKKFASGGFVNMGSGVRDDVPALLSGGEYVIKKSSVNKIGRNNLDRLNNIKGYALGGNVNFNLKNEFETFGDKDRPNSGAFNIDPNLSSIALTDENNPQNALKFARENYIKEKVAYDEANRKTLAKYEKNQKQSYYIQFGTALLNAGLQGYSQYSSAKNLKTAQYGLSAADAGIEISKSDISAINKFTSQGYGLNAIRAGNLQNATKYNYNLYQANGGLIRGFANGGVFGAESPLDKYPAMLMGGEYVVKKPVVDKMGVNFFDNLNRTGRARGFAEGGYVGNASSSMMESSDVPKYLSELISVSQEIRDTLSNKDPNNTQSQTAPGVNIIVNTTINVASDGSVKSQESSVSSDKEKDDNTSFTNEDAKKLTDSINAQINTALGRESRPGGILYERFKTRG